MLKVMLECARREAKEHRGGTGETALQDIDAGNKDASPQDSDEGTQILTPALAISSASTIDS
jgi:hypothetical protein